MQWPRYCSHVFISFGIVMILSCLVFYEYLFIKSEPIVAEIPSSSSECTADQLHRAQTENNALWKTVTDLANMDPITKQPDAPAPLLPGPGEIEQEDVSVESAKFQAATSKLPPLHELTIWPPPAMMKIETDNYVPVFMPVVLFKDLRGNLPREVWQAHEAWLFPHASRITIPEGTNMDMIQQWELRSEEVIENPSLSVPYGSNEAYTLHVDAKTVSITAPTTFGLMRGLTSLAQVIQWDTLPGFGQARVGRLPSSLHIVDEPRFGVRSFLVDPPRVFFSVGELERVVDILALQKMNTLHLRLSDEEHFRFPLESFPGIVEGEGDEVYSMSELQDLVHYAFVRGVRVIPEIDIPGHAGVFARIDPEYRYIFNCSGEEWSHNLDPRQDEVYAVMKQILTELILVFPDPLFHLGHDELTIDCWDDDLMSSTGYEFTEAQWYDFERLGISLRGVSEKLRRARGQIVRHDMMVLWSKMFQQMLWGSNDPILESRRYIYWGDMFKWLEPNEILDTPYDAAKCIWEPWIQDNTATPIVDVGYDILYGNFFWTYLDQMFKKDVPVRLSDSLLHWISTFVRDLHKEHLQENILTLSQLEHYLGFEVQMWEHGFVSYQTKVWPILTAYSAKFWMQDSLLMSTDLDIVRDAFRKKLRFDEFLRDNLRIIKDGEFSEMDCGEMDVPAEPLHIEFETILSNLVQEIKENTNATSGEVAMWPYLEKLKHTSKGLCGARDKIDRFYNKGKPQRPDIDKMENGLEQLKRRKRADNERWRNRKASAWGAKDLNERFTDDDMLEKEGFQNEHRNDHLLQNERRERARKERLQKGRLDTGKWNNQLARPAGNNIENERKLLEANGILANGNPFGNRARRLRPTTAMGPRRDRQRRPYQRTNPENKPVPSVPKNYIRDRRAQIEKQKKEWLQY